MTDNIYRGAKVNPSAQQNQSVDNSKGEFIYRGIKHQAKQQGEAQQKSGIYRGAKWKGGTEKNDQMR